MLRRLRVSQGLYQGLGSEIMSSERIGVSVDMAVVTTRVSDSSEPLLGLKRCSRWPRVSNGQPGEGAGPYLYENMLYMYTSQISVLVPTPTSY